MSGAFFLQTAHPQGQCNAQALPEGITSSSLPLLNAAVSLVFWNLFKWCLSLEGKKAGVWRIPGGWRNSDVSFPQVKAPVSCLLWTARLYFVFNYFCINTKAAELTLSLYAGVASPVKAPQALCNGLRAVLFSQQGEKKAAGWEHTVYLSLKKQEGRGFGDLFVCKPKLISSKPKSQSGVWLPELQGCAVFALLGEGSKAGPMQRWAVSGASFSPNQASRPVPVQSSCCVCCAQLGRQGSCDTMPGASRQLFVRRKRVFTSIASLCCKVSWAC